MKQAVVLLSNRLKREKIEHKFCANVHDEWQIETKEETADLVGQYGVWSIQEAGRIMEYPEQDSKGITYTRKGMRCPLDGAYRVGLTWKDTH
jgi:hypothetical protein